MVRLTLFLLLASERVELQSGCNTMMVEPRSAAYRAWFDRISDEILVTATRIRMTV